MKQIWNEKIKIGCSESKYYRESSYDYEMGHIPARVAHITRDYEVVAVAAYDKRYRVLKLTMTCVKHDYSEFNSTHAEVASETELQQFDSRENAIRWLIERVEKFRKQMAALVPPNDDRSDEDVERAYYAEIERRKQAKAKTGGNE